MINNNTARLQVDLPGFPQPSIDRIRVTIIVMIVRTSNDHTSTYSLSDSLCGFAWLCVGYIYLYVYICFYIYIYIYLHLLGYAFMHCLVLLLVKYILAYVHTNCKLAYVRNWLCMWIVFAYIYIYIYIYIYTFAWLCVHALPSRWI